MAWWNPTTWDGRRIATGIATGGFSELGGGRPILESIGVDVMGDKGAEEERARKAKLGALADQSGKFADASQAGYQRLGRQGQQNIAGLQRLASGQDSISAEQLRQGLGQNLAYQRSLAAGAAPQNAAMAARTAAIQSGRLGAGFAGQQALAGLQERNQAQQTLAGAIQGLRGQDLQATLGGRQGALAGHGAYTTPMTPEKSFIDKALPAAIAVGSAVAASDRRLKTDIRDGEDDAQKAIEGVRAYVFKYKGKKYGKGRQFGVMADELEGAGLGHAVINTPEGKVVHGAKLATSNTAMIAALGRRLAKVEGRK
jgi:hypothetical protein